MHRLEQNELLEQQNELEFGALQVTLESVLLFLHLFDLLVKVVDVAVDFIHELSLLVFQLNHAHLLHFFVKLRHLLYTALSINEFLVILVDLDFLFDFLLLISVFFGLFLGFSLSFGLFLSILSSFVLFSATALVFAGCLGVDLSLLQIGSVVLNILVSNIEIFLGIFNLLIDDGQDEFLWSAQFAVDDIETLIESLDLRDDVLLAHAKVVHLDIEVDLDLVDGTLQKNHLLPLLPRVNLFALRHLIIFFHLEVVLAEGALGLLNLGLLLLVLASVHHLLRSQSVNLLLPELALNFPLFSPLVSMGFVDLCLAWLADSSHSCLCLVLDFVIVRSVFHIVEHLVFAHLIFLPCCDLTLEDLLKLIDVVREHLRHLRHSECGNVCSSAHGFYRELLEVKDIVELLFDLIQSNSISLDFPLLFFFGFFNLCLRPFNKHVKEVRINVEILLGHLNYIFDLLVLLHDLDESLPETIDLAPDSALLLLSDLEFAILLSSQLGLLDGVDALVFNVLSACWQVERFS